MTTLTIAIEYDEAETDRLELAAAVVGAIQDFDDRKRPDTFTYHVLDSCVEECLSCGKTVSHG